MDLHRANLMGAVLAVIILSLCILIFMFRLAGSHRLESWLGFLLILTCLPLLFLFIKALSFHRSSLYFIQIGIMIAFLILELFLDYIFKTEFRKVTWMLVPYLVLFFGGTGGMIGVASLAGRIWTLSAAILFLVMTVLSLVQRTVTGM